MVLKNTRPPEIKALGGSNPQADSGSF